MEELRRKTEGIAARTIHTLTHLSGGLPLLLLLGGLSQFLLGCASVETRSSTAPGVDLTQYHTFDFAQAKPPADAGFLNPTNEARVKAAVRTEMEKRGFRQAEPADLQFFVYLKATMKTYDRTDPSLGSGSVGSDLRRYYGLLYDNSWGTQSVVTYPEGTLVVQAVDTKQNRKVWEGVATGALHRDAPPQQIEARVHEAVSRMFRHFPKR